MVALVTTTVWHSSESSRSLASFVGRVTRQWISTVGRGAWFVADVVRATGDVASWRSEFSTHARILGVESLPIGIFIALFTGIVLALLASYSVGDLVPP